jgi:hypothetical protein
MQSLHLGEHHRHKYFFLQTRRKRAQSWKSLAGNKFTTEDLQNELSQINKVKTGDQHLEV